MHADPSLRATADALAARLTDPAAAAGGHRQSLSRGAAGVALLHIERAAQNLAGWDIAHAWLAAACSASLSIGPDATASFGAPAVAFALHGAARNGGYRRAQATTGRSAGEVIRHRLDQAHDRIDRGERPVPREFDTINGLTGLAAHLLRHDPGSPLLTQILAYLIRLTQPLKRGDGLPGWWTGQPPAGHRASSQAGGYSNHGMAHGITGCLALLALAMRRGISIAGQAEAISRICVWLDTWQQPHPHGPWWPEIITLDDLRRGVPRQTRPARPSWCYGTPGLARAQQLAGHALAEPARRQLAEHAMFGCLTDPLQLARITDPGLCHGTAGVFQTAWRMAADTPHRDLARQLPRLARLLLTATPGTETSVLDGTAGLALALTTAATRRTATGWDAFLLLS